MAAHQASLSITNSQSLLKLMSIESVMPSNHLILCHPLLLLPSIFPSIRVFSNELTLRVRWSMYWSFSIRPSGEYSGFISFKIEFDLLAVQGTLKTLLQHCSSKASIYALIYDLFFWLTYSSLQIRYFLFICLLFSSCSSSSVLSGPTPMLFCHLSSFIKAMGFLRGTELCAASMGLRAREGTNLWCQLCSESVTPSQAERGTSSRQRRGRQSEHKWWIPGGEMWARAVRAGFLEEAVGGGRSLLSPRPCSLISAHLHNNLPQSYYPV